MQRPRWISPILFILAIVIALGTRSAGQQTTPKVSVSSRLVEVSVVADDKKGKPVSDLTENDFHIFDEGHEQKIAQFEIVTGTPAAPAPLNLPANVYTNLLGQGGTVSDNVTIILLDRENTSFMDQSWVRPQIIKYLGHIKPQDHVALYTLGPDLHIVHDFTSDSASLVAAVRALGSASPKELQQIAAPDPQASVAAILPVPGTTPSPAQQRMIDLLSNFLSSAKMMQKAFYNDEQIMSTLAAFDAIARHVSGVPGRKNLLWVSGAFPISFGDEIGKLPSHEAHDYGNNIEETTKRLSSANVAVYPVDARGLIPEDLGLTQPMISSRREAVVTTLPPSLDPNDILTMSAVAHDTGGLAFFNTNDIEHSIERAVDDSRISYILGYYPDHNQWNGEFRKINVKVDRSHIHVRTRSGYIATISSPVNARENGSVLGQIAASPLNSTSLTIFAKLDPVSQGVPTGSVNAFLNVDPRGLNLNPVNGRWKGRVIAAFIQLDAQGAVLGNGIVEQTVDMDLLPETYNRFMQTGLKLEKMLSVDPKAVELCVVALDESTGNAGSLRIPVGKYQPKQQP